MLYSQETVEEVRMQNDIVDVIGGYLPLKQKGSSHFGLCPFHHESTPSFSVSADKQLYYCFGCGAAGNVFSFIMQMENCDFVEALTKLAERAHITLPQPNRSKEYAAEEKLKKELLDIHITAGRYYYQCLQSESGKKAVSYLEKRRVSKSIQRKFGLGYSPEEHGSLFGVLKEKGFSEAAMVKSGLVLENRSGKGYHDRFYGRLMFPIFDLQGKVIGFGGRIMAKGEPKYLNSPETVLFSKKKILYGLNFARASKSRELIIVEGYMDMISIYQAGFHNVAATLGTAFNAEHASLLRKFFRDIILIFDSDLAGETAALRAIPILVSSGLNVKVAQVPNGKDPDEFIKQYGKDEFGRLLVHAVSHIAFQIGCVKKKYNLEDTEQKMTFTKEAAKIISKIESPIERDIYTKEISKDTDVSEEAVKSEILAIRGEHEKQFFQKAEKNRISFYDKNNYVSNSVSSKGVMEAQRNVIFICATKNEVYQKIKSYITAQDFIDDIYIKIAEIVFAEAEKGNTIFPAEAVNHFTSSEEQKMVAEIFSANFEMDGTKELEKVINECVKLVKRTKADILTRNAVSIEEIKSIAETKRELDRLHITL